MNLKNKEVKQLKVLKEALEEKFVGLGLQEVEKRHEVLVLLGEVNAELGSRK